jgi:hypothetical protein
MARVEEKITLLGNWQDMNEGSRYLYALFFKKRGVNSLSSGLDFPSISLSK